MGERWKTAIACLPDQKLRDYAARFGERFGASSWEVQQESIKILQNRVQEEYRKKRGELEQKGKLFMTLGTLCGAGAAIMLV